MFAEQLGLEVAVSVQCLTFRPLLVTRSKHQVDTPAEDRRQLGVAELIKRAVVIDCRVHHLHRQIRDRNLRRFWSRWPLHRRPQERRLALRQEVILAHKPLNFLGIHDHASAPEDGGHSPVAVEDVLETNTLDHVAQLALGCLAAAVGKMSIIRRARQAREAAEALHVGM